MLLYSAASVITVTLATLGSAGASRESTVGTNTATRYDDAYVTMTITVQTGTAPGGDKALYIYFYSVSFNLKSRYRKYFKMVFIISTYEKPRTKEKIHRIF